MNLKVAKKPLAGGPTGHTANINAVGTAKVQFDDQKLTLSNVRYSLNVVTNLIFFGQLSWQGFDINLIPMNDEMKRFKIINHND